MPTLRASADNTAEEQSIFFFSHMEELPVCAKDIERATLKDPQPLNFLLMYRSTPHTVTGRTPAELFLKCQIRNRFSLLKSELARQVEEKQAVQKRHHDHGGSPVCCFLDGEAVCIPNFKGGVEKWILATVLKRLETVTYLIQEGQR